VAKGQCLELELVHIKKNLLPDNRWEKSSKLIYIYIGLSPVIAKMKIKLFFTPANDLLAITSLLRLFHLFTTLLLKEYFAMSSLTLFYVTLIDDLLNWILI